MDNISAGWENIIVNTGSERINLKFYGAGIILIYLILKNGKKRRTKRRINRTRK